MGHSGGCHLPSHRPLSWCLCVWDWKNGAPWTIMDAQEALARSASVISLTDVLAAQNVVFSSSKIQAWINTKLSQSGSSSCKYSVLLGLTDPECGAHSTFIILLAFCLLSPSSTAHYTYPRAIVLCLCLSFLCYQKFFCVGTKQVATSLSLSELLGSHYTPSRSHRKYSSERVIKWSLERRQSRSKTTYHGGRASELRQPKSLSII